MGRGVMSVHVLPPSDVASRCAGGRPLYWTDAQPCIISAKLSALTAPMGETRTLLQFVPPVSGMAAVLMLFKLGLVGTIITESVIATGTEMEPEPSKSDKTVFAFHVLPRSSVKYTTSFEGVPLGPE